MGVDPITLSIAGGTIMGATSAAGAVSQNRSIERSMKSTVSASQEAIRQIQMQTAIAGQRYVNDARKARGAIRVAGAAGGIRGSDLQALVRQTAYDADLNTRITKMDAANKINKVQSNAAAQLQQLEGQGRSAAFDTIRGGLQGAITGFTLGNILSPASADPALRILAPNNLGAPTEFIA